jgi:hypothetical protein
MSGLLDHTPAQILYEYFKEFPALLYKVEGDSWFGRAFINNDPADKLKYLVYSDTTGRQQGKLAIGTPLQGYGVQIRIRHDDQVQGYKDTQTMELACNALAHVAFTLGSTNYILHGAHSTSPIIRVGREQPGNTLMIYSLNLLTTISKGPTP